MTQNDFLLKCLYDLYCLAIEEKVIFKIYDNSFYDFQISLVSGEFDGSLDRVSEWYHFFDKKTSLKLIDLNHKIHNCKKEFKNYNLSCSFSVFNIEIKSQDLKDKFIVFKNKTELDSSFKVENKNKKMKI